MAELELESFIIDEKPTNIQKNKILVIKDSDYKTTRQSKINFSTLYLSLQQEIRLMLYKNFLIYGRNIKTLIFVFITPIIFLTILQIIQNISNYYSESVIVKNQEIINIENIDLNCTLNTYANFEDDCISIGIAVLGDIDKSENKKINHIINYISNETNFNIGRDIKLITNEGIENMYDYFETYPNKIQYVVAFCYDSYDFSGVKIPCRPSNDSKSDFNIYTIVYNVTNFDFGFFDSFSLPLPSDRKLLKLKLLVDNAYLDYYYSNFKSASQLMPPPKIKNIATQGYPSPLSRFSSNANVVTLMGVFYLYFPPMILFAILLLDLVREKESMLKNFMNIYGLSLIGYWVSWLIIALISSTIVTFELIILGKFVFQFDIFNNVNIIVIFNLFFLFCLTMQTLAMYLSCLIKTTKTATTVSYSVILFGIIIQCFFTNFGVVYFFYATNLDNLWLLVKTILLLLHFYPPFLYSKAYLNISRICSYHFDSPKLQWVPGRYFYLSDLLTKETGKLRIGVEYEVDSLFYTYIWFYILIILFTILIAVSEMKENYKYENLNSNSWIKYIVNYYRFVKDLFKLTSVKRLNIQKQKMEDNMNKYYDRYLKNKQKLFSNSTNEENLSFIVKDNHISVRNEKKIVSMLNKKGTVPNGIRILSLNKTFENGLKALTDINIEITKDEVFTILGPNGAGKSTLINILTNQISCSEGFAKVGPFIIHSDLFLDSVYLKRIIGICSQFDNLWEELTVYETLYIFSKLRGISETRINTYIDEKISEVRLENKKNEKVSNLSGGMRRRLSICISTLGDPFIIFMDEPTSGLDPNNRRKIWKLINNIKKNRVIILTTHIMEEAEYLSDRLGIIIGGKLRFIGNCTDMRALYWDGIILTLNVDLTKLDKQFYIFDDNIKFIFIRSQLSYSSSGIYQILIKNDNKKDVIKAFEIFNRKSIDNKTAELFDYIKDVTISQANMENIYLDLCKKYQ